jgi:type II secretory pathway component GspD/PulD (secretin)
MMHDNHPPASAHAGGFPLAVGVLGLALLILLTGCQKPLYRTEDLAALLDAYRKQEAQIRERQRQAVEQGIRRLEIRKTPDGHLVTVDLDRASLAPVIRQILDQSQVPFLVLDDASLGGEVTARFENFALVQAVNFLLRGQGLSATLEQGLLIIREGGAERPAGEVSPTTSRSSGEQSGQETASRPTETRTVPLKYMERDVAGWRPEMTPTETRTVPLKYMEGAVALKFLQDLFAGGESSERISVSYQPYTNTLSLMGPARQVAKAASLLRRMDTEPSHVFIEALVIEVNSDAIKQLGVELQKLATQVGPGDLRDVASAFGVPGVPASTFTYLRTLQHAQTTITGIINLMVSSERARIISRPYLSTVSGREAKIDISVERYAITQSVSGGTTVTTTTPVAAGIRLGIIPIVLKDRRMQLSLSVEDSQFVDAVIPNISVIKDRNLASTTMMVESEQSVIIGGLVLDRRTEQNAGLPYLRNIPVVNFFTAQQGTSVQKQEVVIFITPHVWTPGMTPPLAEPHAFKVPEAKDIGKPFKEEWQLRIEP